MWQVSISVKEVCLWGLFLSKADPVCLSCLSPGDSHPSQHLPWSSFENFSFTQVWLSRHIVTNREILAKNVSDRFNYLEFSLDLTSKDMVIKHRVQFLDNCQIFERVKLTLLNGNEAEKKCIIKRPENPNYPQMMHDTKLSM